MRIAIVKLSAIGDIVHAMIVLQFIKIHYPHVIIDWFVDYELKDILENNPHINKIYPIKLKQAKTKKSFIIFMTEILKLRRIKKYNLVIDMQNLIKSAIVAKIIPSLLTVGLDKDSSREKIASIFYNQRLAIPHSSNVIIRNISIINAALGMHISKEDIINKQAFLFYQTKKRFLLANDKPNILLVLGASFEAKVYPVERYAEIVEKMHGNFLVLWGSQSERLNAQKIKALSPQVNILEKLTLDELKSLISKVTLVIGGDTGPVHMAWALGVSSVMIFGPTPGNRNAYLTKVNKIIESKSKVNPYKINKNDLSIRDINSNEIVKIAEKLVAVLQR